MTTFEDAARHYHQLYADDDLERYDATRQEQWLQDQYKFARYKFDNMVKDMHIPFLDVKLYKQYFQTVNEQNLQLVLTIVEALSDHKQSTIKMLRMIFEREQIVNVIKVMEYDYTKGKLSTLEVQTKVLQLLYSLQQVTLRFMEGLQEWRSKLTRPFAFEWRGINYVFKIIKDCQFIDSCELSSVLPLQLSSYPLCSNLNSLNLFGPSSTGNTNTTPTNNNNGGGIAITYPMKVSKKTMIPQLTPELQRRLKEAEVMIFSEHNLQVNLMKELAAINSAGAFLTLLDLKEVIPSCIRLNNKEWDKRLRQTLSQSFAKLQLKLDAPSNNPSPVPPNYQAQFTSGFAVSDSQVGNTNEDSISPTP